jgi:hypothetical protein
VSEEARFLADGFITESTNSFGYSLSTRSCLVFNFVVEIPLILTYDIRSFAQTMNDSPFYVMWVVGLEVQITTSMIRLPVQFYGQFRTPLHNQNFHIWKGIISLNFRSEFDGRRDAVDMVGKSL